MDELITASLAHFSFAEIVCLFLLFKMDKSINELNATIKLILKDKEDRDERDRRIGVQ